MIFACMPAYGGDERETILWAASIRRHCGDSSSTILILEPETSPLSETTCRALEQIARVTILPFKLPEDTRNFPYAQKVFAAAQAEAYAADDLLVWMDSDTLLLASPDEFLLPPGKTIGCCPVQLKNISSLASEPVDAFWQAIYTGCATPPERIFPVAATVDKTSIRAHFNAGLLVVRPQAGLLRAWKQNFERLYQAEQFQPFYAQKPLYRIFTHQAILSATLLACLPESEIHLFSPRYNVPIFLRNRFLITIPHPITCRYDEYAFFQDPAWSSGEAETDAEIRTLLDESRDGEAHLSGETPPIQTREPIQTLLRAWFDGLNQRQEDLLAFWHPAANLIIHGEARPITFFKEIPPFVNFELAEIEMVDAHEQVASAKVSWRMHLPGSTGIHTSYFTLVQVDGRWLIASQVDFGLEQAEN